MTTLTDGLGKIWDIDSGGYVINGSNDAFDDAYWISGYTAGETGLEDGGREIVFAAQLVDTGISMQRKVYVSDTQGFARFLTAVTNTGSTATTYELVIRSDYGSDFSTSVLATSSGDTTLDGSDAWIISDDSTTGSGGSDPVNLSIYAGSEGAVVPTVTRVDDVLTYTYTLNLAAGETAYVMQIATQADSLASAESLADTWMTSDAVFAGLSDDEVSGLVNWGAGSTISSNVTYTLQTGEENLTLTGSGAINGTGNELDNDITGNDSANRLSGMAGDDELRGGGGKDTLIGGAGADTLAGGAGNDTYIVDALDTLVEEAGGGIDTILAGFSYSLRVEGRENIENLTLTGTSSAKGIGNALGNRITGNGAANRLIGLAGNDTLVGGGGNDTLDGGLGDDTYIVNNAGVQIVESYDQGIDTVRANRSFDLSSQTGLLSVENLVLTGTGTFTGTGNDEDNFLTGNGASNLLRGLDGNDTLLGGGGVDTLVGGSGDDVYVVDTTTDVINEGVGGGSDTVVSSVTFSLVGRANVENLALTGSAVRGTGNGLNNLISGTVGNNRLEGNGGNDMLIGNAGNDTLVGGTGNDTLSGGYGNDRYLIDGAGNVVVTDIAGIDTLDFSSASTGATINLAGVSTVNGKTVTFDEGGLVLEPLDVVLLQDLSGSFYDDIVTVRSLAPTLISALTAYQPDSRFGVSSFVDKPTYPFGSSGDYVYRTDQALTSDVALFQATLDSLTTLSGSDEPEAQLEALLQLAKHTAEVGYRSDAVKVVVLTTDASYHVAGDFAGVPANDGDAVMEGTPEGTGEDYPTIAQVRGALLAAGIVPIFAVTSGNETSYQSLVTQLGFGSVVNLTSDSSNLVNAITAGIDAITVAKIENAVGTNFNDTISGNVLANLLNGGAGADVLKGLAGNDTLLGGAGNDKLYGGVGKDQLTGGTGADTFYFGAIGETAPGAARDVIKDFNRSQGDKIHLAGIDANPGLAGDQAFQFIGGNAFSGTDATGQLRFAGGVLYGSTDADSAAEFSIQIVGMTAMQASDFVL